MHIQASTIDDLMYDVFKNLLDRPFDVNPTRGKNSEKIGVMLSLDNPLARLSRTETKGKLFSAVGELLWYLSKSNNLDFISYYIPRYTDDSEDGKTIYGGYGPRLFNSQDKYNQIENVIALLTSRPNSRRAVIQIFEASDIVEEHKEIPCTCSLQLFLRDNKLSMVVHMRSNDAFKGLPHDIFCFTMIQEIIAKTLNVEVGTYKHSVGSLHLYETDKELAEQYLSEGYQSTKNYMPPMPNGDPGPSINTILRVESDIRNGAEVNIDELGLNPYWGDIARLIYIYTLFRKDDKRMIKMIQNTFHSPIYNTFINTKLAD